MLASGRRADGRENEAVGRRRRQEGGRENTDHHNMPGIYENVFLPDPACVTAVSLALNGFSPPQPYPLSVARIFISNFLIEL